MTKKRQLILAVLGNKIKGFYSPYASIDNIEFTLKNAT